MDLTSQTGRWNMYKDLKSSIEMALDPSNDSAFDHLENFFTIYKLDFLNFLQNPARNLADRELVLNSHKQGLVLENVASSLLLTQDFINESIILSELFELNEIAAVDLLLLAESQQPFYPGLTRGLVAVLLYFDSKLALAESMQMLMQARKGRTWLAEDLNPKVTDLISKLTDQIVETGFVSKIIGLMAVYDENVQLERLQMPQFLAVGPPKHRHKVIEKIRLINAILGNCLFFLSCQTPLSKSDTLLLIGRLSMVDKLDDFKGHLCSGSLALLMSLLYSFDLQVLELEDSERWLEKLPLIQDATFVVEMIKELSPSSIWTNPGLKSLVLFSWSLCLLQLSPYLDLGETSDLIESSISFSLEQNIFFFIRTSVLQNPYFFTQEYYLRKMHLLITDFIVLMPIKVKELRSFADDMGGRGVGGKRQEIPEGPENKEFQHLLLLIKTLYYEDNLSLKLSNDFWCSNDSYNSGNSFLNNSFKNSSLSQRQVTLYKFIRLAGDMLTPSLYTPYIEMLTGLSTNQRSANCCFNLLRLNAMTTGSHANIISWEHFFSSLNNYYINLKQDVSIHQQQQQQLQSNHQQQQLFGHQRNVISEQDVDGLVAVLTLITTVIRHDSEARVKLSGKMNQPILTLFGLITCPIPIKLKAALMRTLAAFALNQEVAANLWLLIEKAQFLSTGGQRGSTTSALQVELEEMEPRSEEYPLTRGFIDLLKALLSHPFPASLSPAVNHYIEFLRNPLFLKLNHKSYKHPSEKWEVCSGLLEIFHLLICRDDLPTHPILTHVFADSHFLKMMLFIIDESIQLLSKHIPSPEEEPMTRSSLLSLLIIETSLSEQDKFFEVLRASGKAGVAHVGLDKLIFGINQRTGKSDHLINIAKFVIHNNSHPKHALKAVQILSHLCLSPYSQPKMVPMFSAHQNFSKELLCAFAECLECDEAELADDEQQNNLLTESESETRSSLRMCAIKLLLISIKQKLPNMTHFLCGFDVKGPLHKSQLHDPGINSFPRTCLHSLIITFSKLQQSSHLTSFFKDIRNYTEAAYKFISYLCTDLHVHPSVLRYLRAHDFLYKQASCLPFQDPWTAHMAWLLRSIVVDLKVAATNKQRSYVQRFISLFLSSDSPKSNLEFSLNKNTVANSSLIFSIFNAMSFQLEAPPPPQLTHFHSNLLEQLVLSCSLEEEKGLTLVDVSLLYKTLVSECMGLTGPLAFHREKALLEITDLCANISKRNKYRKNLFSLKEAFLSWKQLVEVMLTAVPRELLAGEERQLLIIELLQTILFRIASDLPNLESSVQIAGLILTLSCQLNNSFHFSNPSLSTHLSSIHVPSDVSMLTAPIESLSSLTVFSSSLQNILSGIIQYLVTTASSSFHMRSYLYGAVLYCLEMAEKPKSLKAALYVSDNRLTKLLATREGEYEKACENNMTILNKMSAQLLNCLCKDLCDGHDVSKMMSMAVLEEIIGKDQHKLWLNDALSKGYIKQLIKSLLDDDRCIQNILTNKPQSLKELFIFQSKISLLTKISKNPYGANLLLSCDLISTLSQCNVIDFKLVLDNLKRSYLEGQFIPSTLSNYQQQVLLPVLSLLLSILTSLGSDNSSSADQVFFFVKAHFDLFLDILSQQNLFHHTLQSLTELQLVTGIVCRTAHEDVVERAMLLDAMYGDMKLSVSKLKRLMTSLLLTFNLSQLNRKNIIKHILDNSSLEVVHSNQEASVELLVQEILSNALTLSRVSITRPNSKSTPVQVLFSPSLGDAMKKNFYSHTEYDLPSSALSSGSPLSLGVLVQMILDGCKLHAKAVEECKTIQHKYTNLSELTTSELKELMEPETSADRLPMQQRNQLVSWILAQKMETKSKQTQLLLFIIENSTLLLWRHLDFYLVTCQSRRGEVGESLLELGIPREVLANLRRECQTWINDSFFKSLQEVEQGQSGTYPFLGALSRKILRVVSFNSTI